MTRFAIFAPGWLTLATLVGLAAAAQAPRITPAGDPSVRSDTIYKLAINPSDSPEEAQLLLLDDGVVRVETDGRHISTFRQVVQILTQSAVEGHQEHSFGYEPSHQKLTINWIRVVRPDGSVVSAKPAQVQESDVPAEMSNPVYTETRVKRVSLTGVAPGTIVDYSYTLEENRPARSGDFAQWWGVSTGLQVKRSRLIVDLPASMKPVIVERNLNFSRTTSTANGRTTYMWATKDMPRLQGEPFAADSNGVYMSLTIAAPTTWADIGSWYAGLARGRYALPGSAESALRQAVARAKTRDDSIRAVHRWVAQDIRYVSIALGKGGYQPREPGTVISTGFGDCKDKATLFVAALDKLGMTAFPVLLRAGGRVDRRVATVSAFDHAIAAVKTDTGYVFTDLTADLVPYGTLPYDDQGQFGLVVHPDGQTEEVTIPMDAATTNRTEWKLDGALSTEGMFDGRYEQTGAGVAQATLRSLFEHPLDSTVRANLTRSLASRFFPGAVGDSLSGFDGRDLSVDPRMSLRISHGQAAKPAGDNSIFTIPFGPLSAFGTQADAIAAHGARKFPIDALKVIGPEIDVVYIRLTLPVGWRARLPKSVSASSPFGSYESSYAQDGRELRISRTVTGARGIFSPDRVGDLVSFFRAIAADDATFIVLDRGGATTP